MPSLSRPVYHRPKALRASRLDSGRAAWGHEHVHFSLGVVSGYGRGTARRRSCIVVVRRPLSLARFIALLYMVPCVSVLER